MLTFDDLDSDQTGAIDFLYNRDRGLLLADVGTGKTVIMQTVLQWWLEDGICDRALAFAPPRVCLDAWPNEWQSWEHLDPDILSIGVLHGLSPDDRMAMIANTDVKTLVCNYELLPWLTTHYPDGLPDVNAVICDEIDKLKNHKSLRFKGRAKKRYRDDDGKQVTEPKVIGMKEWRDHFEIHVGMTGTPVPNKLHDIWAQTYIIDGGERFGDDFYVFRKQHFMQTDWAGYDFEVLPGREQWIYEQLGDICYRIEAKEGEGRPVTRELPVRYVDMPPKARNVYSQMERDYIAYIERDGGLLPDDPTDTEELIADSAGVQYGKLRQFAQGLAYVGDPDDKVREYEWVHKAKFAELDDLISELQGQQLMIVYHYKAQLDYLQETYGDAFGYLGGGQTKRKAQDTLDMWNAGKLPLLGIHPDSAGHGLNLQHSGAHHIVFLTLPETPGMYTQVIGRLSRRGNPAAMVYVHFIYARDTTDAERHLVVREHKMFGLTDLLDAMRKRQ